MRKLFILISLILLVMSSIGNLSQDSAEVTIAEIVTMEALGSADDPEFETLLAALEAVDPTYLDLLSNQDARVTVFAPTDEAFENLLEEMDVDEAELLEDTALLEQVLSYHIVPTSYVAESIVTLDGALIGTILPGAALTVSVDDENVLLDDAMMVDANLFASNGIIHVVDSVLVPAMPEQSDEAMEMEEEAPAETDEELLTIAELVVGASNDDPAEFTILLAALEAADESLLASLSDGGPFTVFAPTDAAFLSAFDMLGVTDEEFLANSELVTLVLEYHVLPGEYLASDLATLSMAFEEDSDESLRIATLLPGVALDVSGEADALQVSYATVVTPDVMADNGIVHVIGEVLIPPNLSLE